MDTAVPMPEDVIKELSTLLWDIRNALEHGTQRAREYFDNEQTPLESYLGAQICRFQAKRSLAEYNVLDEEEKASYDLHSVANNGLSLSCGRYNLRILKAPNGNLPTPGRSIRRQGFYCQLPLFSLNRIEGQERQVNLLVLWDTNKEFSVDYFALACPKSGGISRDSVDAHWHVDVSLDSLFETGTQSEPVHVEDLALYRKGGEVKKSV